MSSRQEASFTVAVVEGRGISREVGIAALDKGTGQVILVQLADCQTYVKTLHQLYLHSPCLILVPDTSITSGEAGSGAGSGSSLLVEYMRDEFPSVPVEVVGRKYWNSEGGLEFVSQLCVNDEERAGTILTVANKYYALSATCALFKHTESRGNTRFAPASLRIQYTPVDGTMLVDPDTARNLELVGNLARRKSKHSLFGTMDFTYTAMGARLLRVNLLSPLTSETVLNSRLDAVDELVRCEDLFGCIKNSLKFLNKTDFDKLIASLAALETRPTESVKMASSRVTQMLNLRNVIKNVPLVQRALSGSRSRLLRCLHDMLDDERITRIADLVDANLNEEVGSARGGITSVNARVYAVKANCNKFLDVARETFKENIGDIYQLAETLSRTHEMPLTLVYQETGFVFCLKKDEWDEEQLPRGFINPTMAKGKRLFTSMDLKKMNARMKDALDETLMLSSKMIQDLVSDVLVDVGALYKASEAIALLDMLWAFAHGAILRNYVRPEFTGVLAIKAGRHPILETIHRAGEMVPNDVFCDESSAFQLIQGPNMSGKSTYLRQTGLLAVMAMCGSFVPAEYASFRIHDSLLSRLSDDDDLERNLSTFASEMASSAMILGLTTDRSLVLIDELGRGTSPREGVGIAHAIAERLVSTKCFVFFASHFHELVTTLSRQPSVVNLHLAVQRSRRSETSFGLTFQYRIVNGVATNMEHYGLDLARLADLPEDVMVESIKISEELSRLNNEKDESSRSAQVAARRRALLKLRTTLRQLVEHSKLPDQDLLAYIERVQLDVVKAFRTAE